ncbi:DNA cytosine methyltransferase [Limimaricola cinnabarinus]|uniref:DNA cytosine methyltransferase n=1 Tax=Limimaricola cinnabarinus TaxID=1125964 RepID=UPI002490A787|nr:DNA cytosine methyltransferase [Limimaricola cinnabarinus]
MSEEFAIIDLFAGPGGLGEGFSRAGRDPASRMKIRLSVEMDDYAIQTLRLRAFLRSFEDFPREYYEALNAGDPLPEWADLYPNQWKHAVSEVRQGVLGAEGVFEELACELDRARETYNGNTILIGGPPCQAYSLAGRSRNKGKADYVPEDDERHYLYREYVRILDRLRPAAFVMENVKGMLSSKVDGGGIFSKVLDDLENAGDGYRLLPLARPAPADGSRAAAQDFLIRAEDHGVPQARHRVIILGIRSDLAEGLVLNGPLVPPHPAQISVNDVIGDLLRLRSGLSSKDDFEAWQAALRDQATAIAASDEVPDEIRELALSLSTANDIPRLRSSQWKAEATSMPEHLRAWFADSRLEATLQHETRGHIPQDLGRYLYSAAFTRAFGSSPKLIEFPEFLQPQHKNRASGDFADRFRTQAANRPATTVTSHISKDGHYFIHPDPYQCRSLTVREAARLQTFPDNYLFSGPRTKQYHQVGNAVPPFLAWQIAKAVRGLLG